MDVSAYNPLIVAHRGGVLGMPHAENSREAFESAHQQGFLSECDVWASADGIPVVIHDATLDRMTNESGRVDERSAADLVKIRLRSASDQLATIPLLADVAQHIRLLEIKPANAPRLVESACTVMAGRLWTAMSFDDENLRHVRRADPQANIAFVVDETERIQLALDERWPVYLNHELLNDRVVGHLRDAGLAVGVWTVNNREAIARVAKYRADVVISDSPAVIRRTLGQAGSVI
jgi:glycerophosphoryl diester phosphodiesterase